MSHDNIDDAMAKKYETDLSACKLRARQLETENAELREALEEMLSVFCCASNSEWAACNHARAILDKTK